MNMDNHKQPTLSPLSQQDIEQIHGAGIGPVIRKPPMAEDMYGNKLSMEAWMDHQLAVAYSGGLIDPHVFR